MIKLITENLFRIAPGHGISAVELREKQDLIGEHLKKIDAQKLGFYKVIDDKNLNEDIHSFAEKTSGGYSHIVVLGIGGSALGTICIEQSLSHLFKPSKLLVADNIDPVIIKELEETINLEKTLFIVVTKSGSTPETISQFFYFKDKCEKERLPVDEHFVIVTDPEKGLLRKIAETENIPSFEVPQNTGGRFSVLTAVGLLPAALIGKNIEALLLGARKMRDNFLSQDPEKNLPFRLATIQYLSYLKGKNINVIIPYAQKLIKFADWYRQLLAESIGKKTDRKGNIVNVGITPVNALGVTDQHSQSQLYNEGPNDKLHIFIKVNNTGPQIKIPNPYPEEKSIAYINNITFNKLIVTEMEGTVRALTQNDRPNITIEIDRIDEETLGGLFMLFEGATAFLGEFFNINAFDQPGVELSKQITKQLLSPNHD